MSGDIESIIAREGFYLFTGNGVSMLPLIRDGLDTVEVRVASEPVEPGDVILFRNDGRYVLHRVIRTDGDILIVRGDNNYADETVSAVGVIGVMTGLWRGERKVSLASVKYRVYTILCVRYRRIARTVGLIFWR